MLDNKIQTKQRDKRGRFLKGIRCSPETEFKKGQAPRNFGRGQFQKGHPGYLKHPNSTSFKKGQLNLNKDKKGLWGPNKGSFQNGLVPWTKGRFGEKATNWRGGRTAFSEAIRRSRKYIEWRLAIYSRDNFTCQVCGIKEDKANFDAHHIKPFTKILKDNKIKNVKDAMLCKELWDISNGITFCSGCHNLTKYGRRKI